MRWANAQFVLNAFIAISCMDNEIAKILGHHYQQQQHLPAFK